MHYRLAKPALIGFLCSSVIAVTLAMSGCVNQYPEGRDGPKPVTGHERVVATSRAIAEILVRLNVDVIGVPQSELEISDRLAGAVNVGTSMNPDMEIIRSLQPDWVFSPKSLESALQPRFEAARIDVAFLNLRSIDHMYASIAALGPLLMRETEAQVLLDEYEDFKVHYREELIFDTPPRVLILMGLPGSYLVATKNSYIGSLVAMTGAINVYEDQTQEFISVDAEDMLLRQPDIILRAAHALPEEVLEMFDKEFRENDTWKHFDAVMAGNVFDLPHNEFGMSATFEYPQALATLRALLEKAR
jgi:iron complex transport system substrate-binding protein